MENMYTFRRTLAIWASGTLLLIPFLALTTVPAFSAIGAPGDGNNPAQVLQGLGSSYPAAPNVSQSPLFMVYRWVLGSEKIFQINTLQGKLVGIVTIAPKNVAKLFHIGVLMSGRAKSRALPALSGSGVPEPMTSTDCPCATQVVASGPWGQIIVVYGSNGQVISVVTICSSGVSCKQHE